MNMKQVQLYNSRDALLARALEMANNFRGRDDGHDAWWEMEHDGHHFDLNLMIDDGIERVYVFNVFINPDTDLGSTETHGYEPYIIFLTAPVIRAGGRPYGIQHDWQARQWLIENDPEAAEYWKTAPEYGLIYAVYENLKDFGADDAELTAEQLDDKYNPDGNGRHPVYTHWDWKQEVASGDTLLGYWSWVYNMIQNEE